MALSEKDVRGIAEYAKIALTDDELTHLVGFAVYPHLNHGASDLGNLSYKKEILV